MHMANTLQGSKTASDFSVMQLFFFSATLQRDCLSQVPAIPLGDLMREQIQEMGPHFRYVGDIQEENKHMFDLGGALMVTGLADTTVITHIQFMVIIFGLYGMLHGDDSISMINDD